jgi:hypothetical protein
MWLSTGGGFWLYSVGASQDVEYPQKYASLYNGSTQRIVCDPEDGIEDTGAVVYEGDFYTFKVSKVHVLDNSDPNNIPRDISLSIGCDFPNTITSVDNTTLGRCVLFISNRGPAILRSGGVIELLSRHKLIELWPGGYFHVDQDTGLTRTDEWKRTVHANWYKNAWRVLVPGQSIPTLYCFHTDPKDNTMGSFVDTVADDSTETYIHDPVVIIVKNDNVAYALSSKLNVYRLSQFLKRGAYQDYFGSEYCAYNLKTHSRRRGLNRNQTVMGEISDIILHCDMKDTNGLTVIAYCDNNRFNATMVYSENVDTDLESAGYDDIRTMIQGILKEGSYGRNFSILVNKVVPSDGDFSIMGVDMNIQPQEDFGAEFYDGFSDRVKGWE